MIKKIVGIFVCMLLIATATSVAKPIEHQVPKQSPVSYANGLTFSQVDFYYGNETQKNSDWGHMEVEIAEITQDLKEGFLNIYTDAGWVVRNEFINPIGEINFLSMDFDLGVKPGEEIQLLTAYVEFSPEPYVEFKDGPRDEYEVQDTAFSDVGVGDYFEFPHHMYDPIPFDPDGYTYDFTKPIENSNENVQCAAMQCFPMAIANSLQYLENRHPTSFIVPHDHKIGLKGDNSLVGQLDTYVNRYAPSRSVGGGTMIDTMIPAKFDYLADNGLANKLIHKHQGGGYGHTNGDDITHAGITSKDESVDGEVTFKWIEEQLRACEDVELVRTGHAVRVYGCGKVLGKPYLRYLDDSSQTNSDPTDTQGLRFAQIDVSDIDSDGKMNWGSSSREVYFALAESAEKAKSQDTHDAESEWTRDRAVVNSLSLWFLEQFPILQLLLQRLGLQ